MQFFISNDRTHIERKVYAFLDLMGDVGGVSGAITLVLGTFIFPISKFSFYLKAISKMYLARTEDSDLFVKKSLKKGCTGKNRF